ncbi:MAG: hypothetical protein K9J85_04980 [Desulfobacteraceae bacterium]|nr:hypothetical protein [Desulfobacteraceae bacterium]
MRHFLVVRKSIALLFLLVFVFAGCAPLIGPYSPKAYENATSLKAQTLELMGKAVEPYEDHKSGVDSLFVELRKAHEYVRGVPSNSISAEQWEILIKKDGDLLGKFFKRWQERSTLSTTYINEFKNIVSDAFDEIICLETNKKEPSQCKPSRGE